jgi:PAS domain S-box-containing protein
MTELSLFHEWSAASPYALAQGLAAIFCTVLAFLGWRRRARPGGVQFAAMMAAAAVWALFYALELVAPSLGGKVLWAKLEYLGIVPLPLMWYLFARAHTGAAKKTNRGLLTVIGLVPVVTLVLVATNEWHGLMWSQTSLSTSETMPVLVLAHGPWFWVHVAYCYSLLTIGSLLLLSAVHRHPQIYRQQAVMLMIAALVPWFGNVLSVFWVVPAGGIDLTPFAFTVTGVALVLSMSRFRLLTLVPALLPMARNQVLETMKDGVLVLDADGRVVYLNPTAADMLGERASEVVGKTTSMVLGEASADRLDGKKGLDSQFEIHIGERESLRSYDVVSSPLGLGGGVGAGRLLVLRDITERYEAEQALKERDDQLRQAQKMEAIGQLAGGIAHDFNNILTAIIGYSDLILSGGASDAASCCEDVGEIKAAADRASNLTRQILAFSRRQALQPEVISLNDVVTGTERLLGRTLGEHIELVTLLEEDLGPVEVDGSQFEQVLMNLAVNARDAMRDGGRLTIETDNVALSDEYCRQLGGTSPGQHVMLSVSDNGVGMDEETREHAFEPFFTTKDSGRGTGLGLSTVYGIVKQSGGVISVWSELGKGTTIKVYLPRAERPKTEHATTVLESDSETGDETILLVEDEASVRILAKRILERLGYRVEAAANGDDALVLLEDDGVSIDLLLTDVILSGSMQGNELAQAAQLLRPELAVLHMSGYARDTVVHAGRLDEGVNYLPKPFTADVLGRRVRELLDRKGAVR